LSARRVNGRLELRVCDDGVGLPEGWRIAIGKGVGLLNTEARLRQLYGADFTLEARNREQGGVEVLVDIPFRLASTFDDDERREK
jgi:LytS/YehU family sensor histidine kinase